MLVAFAESAGVTATEAVEAAIRAHCRPDSAAPGTVPPRRENDVAVAALVAQLAKKDEQIAKLMETVADSTKAVQGAQALHHETARALLPVEPAGPAEGRWRRLVRAWRG